MNITLIGKSLEPNKQVIDRRLLTFCGIQPSFIKMLEDFHLQFMVKPYAIYFDYQQEIYRIQDQYPFTSILQYGFSHFTANLFFDKLIQLIKNLNPTKLKEQSFGGLLEKLVLDTPTLSGLQYLSEVIGLDELYIRDYIVPVIQGSYLHDVNSVSLMYKLLPLYCPKSLFLALDERDIQKKVINNQKTSTRLIENITIKSHKKEDSKQIGKNKIQLKLSNQKTIETDILFIVEDYQENNIKQISYFKTVVDGHLFGDQNYPQVYTMYFHKNIVLSATRLCANDCKNYRNGVYLLISKDSLTQKDLTMFAHHQIMYQQQKWLPMTQLPTRQQRFQQTQGIYRIQQTQSVSDNFQIKLSVFRNLANIIAQKYS